MFEPSVANNCVQPGKFLGGMTCSGGSFLRAAGETFGRNDVQPGKKPRAAGETFHRIKTGDCSSIERSIRASGESANNNYV
jgi:hypothetical protein